MTGRGRIQGGRIQGDTCRGMHTKHAGVNEMKR